jgi:hypothetical protein
MTQRRCAVCEQPVLWTSAFQFEQEALMHARCWPHLARLLEQGIPPMLCEILRDPARLDDARYVAEPKFDGQRAQIHVAGGRTVAAYSRLSLDLLRHPGLAWLREVRGLSLRRFSMASSAAIPARTAFRQCSRPVAVGMG